MPANKDSLNWLIRTASEQFETHSKKIEDLLGRAQERFAKDHTSVCGGVGVVMIIMSFVFAAIGKAMPFCITGLILGVLVLTVALFLRHRGTDKQIQYTQTLVNLERERALVRPEAGCAVARLASRSTRRNTTRTDSNVDGREPKRGRDAGMEATSLSRHE